MALIEIKRDVTWEELNLILELCGITPEFVQKKINEKLTNIDTQVQVSGDRIIKAQDVISGMVSYMQEKKIEKEYFKRLASVTKRKIK